MQQRRPSPSPEIRPYTLSPHVADLVVDTTDGRDRFINYREGAERRRKVAICGGAGQRTMPWDDPTFECWAMNNFWNTARDSQGRLAASRWWEMHQIFPAASGPHAGAAIQNELDMAWLRQCPVPLYTVEPFPENPRAVVWPVGRFARTYRDYFACTFAMQIAQAFDEGFEELHVHGLELVLGTKREATAEWACVSYWLGYVEGRGMKVVLGPGLIHGRLGRIDGPREQWLLKHPYRYGSEYWDEADLMLEYVARFATKKDAV